MVSAVLGDHAGQVSCVYHYHQFVTNLIFEAEINFTHILFDFMYSNTITVRTNKLKRVAKCEAPQLLCHLQEFEIPPPITTS